MKSIIVYGTRPEAIKLAPVIRLLPGSVIVSTGQHRDLNEDVRRVFGFRDDHNLGLMRDGQSLDELTTQCLQRLTEIFRRERPDVVIVQGDTTTGMAAALAAYYERIPVAHVEAGLRTGDNARPFPEEINRTIIDSIVDYAFCPLEANTANIVNPRAKTYVVGNTVVDALQWAVKQTTTASPYDEPYVYVTAHRRENHGAPLERVCRALTRIAESARVVYPVHPNPAVRSAVEVLRGHDRIDLIDPLDYLESIRYMKHARVILTDSGGIQEEAPSLDVPVLCLREKTERVEVVEAGCVRLVGTDEEKIVTETLQLLEDESAHEAMRRPPNPYGDGTAAQQIVSILQEAFPGN